MLFQLRHRSPLRYRASVIATAGLIAGTAAACASSSSSAATGRATAHPSSSNIVIAGIPGDLTDQFFTAMKCGAQAATKAAGAKLTWQAPAAYTVSSASTLLSSVATTKPNGIMLEGSFTTTGLSSQVAALMKEGIPVTVVDVPISPRVYYQSFYSNNGASGKVVAQSVDKLLKGKGDVGVITATPGAAGEGIRTTSFEKALKAYSGIHVTSVQYANRDTATAAREAAAMLSGNPNLKLIYATDGPQAEGAASAIAAAHKQGAVKLIAFDATPQEIQAVRSGAITGVLAQTPYSMAYDAVKAMISYDKRGVSGAVKPMARSKQNVVTPFLFITKKNVNSAKAKTEFEYPNSCKA